MKAVLVQVLKGYKRWISPMLPMACRYVPSCSEYAMEAIVVHGTVRGSWMAMRRLARCHPFVRGGYDPVVQPTQPNAGWAGTPMPHVCCEHKISTAAPAPLTER